LFINDLLLCCALRSFFTALHKKTLPNSQCLLIMKSASGRYMQCVRFGVVSSILLLLGGTWRNQNGLRFFFACCLPQHAQGRPGPDFYASCGKNEPFFARFGLWHFLCHTMV